MKYLLSLLIFLLPFIQESKGETEPNDNAAQANMLAVNGSQTGTLIGSDQYDWFLLSLPQGGILALTLQKTGGGSGWMYLRDAEKTGFPELTNIYISSGDSPLEGWTLTYPLLAGNYYVQLFKNTDAINYTVISSLTPPGFAEDAEPNDTFIQALDMPVNGSISGTFQYYGAGEGQDLEDWYKLTVPQGGTLQLAIHKKSGNNGWLYFRDGEMAGLPKIYDIYLGWGDTPPEGISWSYPVLAGTYYFQVYRGDYGLPASTDYKIDVSLAPPGWGEDAEPNDSVAIAQNFPLNDSIGGLLGYYHPGLGYDDWDWFKMTTPENGLLSFNITKIGDNNGNVRLRNATAEIATHYLGFGDQNTIFSKIVPVGIYYLGFEKYVGDFRYKVRSSLLPTPVAGFTYAQTGNVFTFENTALYAATYLWKFDDGTTATSVNAYHEYAEPGNFDVCLIATNPAGSDTSCQVIVMPGVARALPAEGGNIGDVTVQVFGGGLDTFYIGKIMSGSTAIATSSFTDFGGKSSINVQFDLRNKPVGTFDLRIEKPGGPAYTLPGGFKIVPGVAANPWVRISGRNRILFNTWTTYTLDYGNYGNVDASFVPIWLTFSNNPGLDVKFEKVNFIDPDETNPAPLPNEVYVELDSLFGKPEPSRVYPLYMRKIPGNTSGTLTIKVKTGGDLKIKAWTETPWFQSPVDEGKVGCLGEALSEAPPELGLNEDKVNCTKLLFVLFAEEFIGNQEYEKPDDPLGFFPLIALIKSATKACGVTNPEDRKKISKWVTNIIINGWLDKIKTPALTSSNSDERSGETCPVEFEPQNPTSNTLTAVNSLDPNEKSGPAGFGAENYLTDTRSFPYAIHFENMATASAPAHTVTVTDQLDLAKFDLATFSFGSVFIGDSVLYVEPGLREFVLDKKLNALGVTARVHGKLDMQTGLVTWTFRSLDALTLEEIEDPDTGFLPPNVNSPEGQGAVMFFVKLKNAPLNNEQIKNSASIVFDANPAIVTNEHKVTFDLVAPQSTVAPLGTVTNTAQFDLNWSGSDVGSGIQGYNIFYIQNGTDTLLWLGGTTETTAIFTGEGASHYEFFSIAVDNVGNTEEAPALPDAETTVLTGTDEPQNGEFRMKMFPNPATDELMILLEEPGQFVLRIYNVDGKRLLETQLSGNNTNRLGIVSIPSGMCYWQVLNGNMEIVKNGKLAVQR
ncbi:MAG: PKD domain-containing protein [Bacteroidetes bacterium]|nr:PKD domain-containing protein [Bacteroidota bacterium]